MGPGFGPIFQPPEIIYNINVFLEENSEKKDSFVDWNTKLLTYNY